MAVATFTFMTLVFHSLCPLPAQVIIGSPSSSLLLEQPFNPSPVPTKQTAWPSNPSRGRSDVPIKATIRNGFTVTKIPPTAVREDDTNEVSEGQTPRSTVQSDASSISTQNLGSGRVLPRPTASRPRTDTASLAFRGKASTKGTVLPVTTTPSDDVVDSAGFERVKAGRPEKEEGDWQEVGSGSFPTSVRFKEEPLPSLPAVSHEMAQLRSEAQTSVFEGPSSQTADVNPLPVENQTEVHGQSALTTMNIISTTPSPETRVTLSTMLAQADPQISDRTAATRKDSLTFLSPRTTMLATTFKQPLTTWPPVSGRSPTNPQPEAISQWTTTFTTKTRTTVGEGLRIASSRPTKTTQSESTTTDIMTTFKTGSPIFTTTAEPVGKGSFRPIYQPGIGQKNLSVSPEHHHLSPASPSSYPTPSPNIISSPNGTLLHWDDLSHTLAFAWELHVYGSASLFLVLFAGAALGLTFSPSTDCPHRGALALANALLFLVGGIRAAFFLVDPYGTRHFLPRAAVIALYNLPLHMLVWAQAALALLALRVAGVSVLPTTLERPPLVAVLAVLQCTLLLAADLLSPALSPAVPVTLQVLSLCWGIVLCLGFLFYVFPRVRSPALPHPGIPEEATRKAWTGSSRTGLILGRVLAVCALLGALCCGLHVHAINWLYGLLGNWKHFTWGWWLVHFWARLLELAWGFSLLLLGSWVFWKPRVDRRREEGGGGAGDGVAGDLPSPCHSAASSHRHTCWSKIVQSLKGKPYKKSDSNGVGRGGGGVGGPGELPNNWAGQERPGADISKSLIRNQNHEQASYQQRCVKDSNRGRNQRGRSVERGVSEGSTGSLLRLQALTRPPQRSLSGSLDPDKDMGVSLYEFDLRPPSPIDLSRSIDKALHREHLLGGGSFFQPFSPPSPSPSPGSGISEGPWIRRNSDPQLHSESSDTQTESSMPLGGSVISSVPSRQVTAPPTPSHQGHRWAMDPVGIVPSSVSCPVSLRPSTGTSTGHLAGEGADDTRPFITPDSERMRGRPGRQGASQSFLEVSRQDDSASVSSEIIDL